MNSRERVIEALSGNGPEVPPVAIFTQSGTVGQMDAVGASWPDAHTDPEKMAALGCAQAEIFGFESVRVPFDIVAEADSLGCTVNPGDRTNLPYITSRALPENPVDGDLPELDLPSPSEYLSGRRMETVCEALSIASKRVDGELPVCGELLGPMGALGQLMSVEHLSLASMLQTDWVRRTCLRIAGLQRAYAEAQRDAGADVLLIIESEASADIISPDDYDVLSGTVVPSMLPSGDVKTVLHMCGDTGPMLARIPETGADALSPDPMVPAADVVRALDGRMRIAGAVDPVGTLLQGTPEAVVSEAGMYAEAGYDVITPGCGLAPMTPDENLRALAGALRR